MLKPGIVFVGKPSITLHELLSIALYLNAPIALSDEKSYEIAKKFSEIIPVFQFSKDFSFNFFMSNLDGLYTNLQPSELQAFFLAHPEYKKLETFHVIEEKLNISNGTKDQIFCSSFFDRMQMIPLDGKWVNLGAIGYLAYVKNKKQIQKIMQTFMPPFEDAKFYAAQILSEDAAIKYNKQHTLDQIQFVNLSFISDRFDRLSNIIPAHGLIDAAIDMTSATIFLDSTLTLLALYHKKPIFTTQPIKGFYEDLSLLHSIVPKEPKNLVPIIENYFEFETIDREKIIKKIEQKFYSHSKFQNK